MRSEEGGPAARGRRRDTGALTPVVEQAVGVAHQVDNVLPCRGFVTRAGLARGSRVGHGPEPPLVADELAHGRAVLRPESALHRGEGMVVGPPELRVRLAQQPAGVAVAAEPDVQPVLLYALAAVGVPAASPFAAEPPAQLVDGDLEPLAPIRLARHFPGGGKCAHAATQDCDVPTGSHHDASLPLQRRATIVRLQSTPRACVVSSTTAEYLVTYVPALLMRRLAASRGRLASEASRVPAAVLIADITGFTPLTERLAERGPVGAELLSELLNGFFAELLDDIHAYGGEALWVAGDATLALWPAEREADLGVAVRRAAACALAIQQRLARRESVGGVRLRARVGVGGGWLWTATVGEGTSWDFVVLGAPLREAGRAASCTGPDEVAAAASVWPLLAGACAGQPLEGGAVRLLRAAVSAPDAAAASPAIAVTAPPRAFMPVPVLARIDEQSGGWLAEFREVSVLFAGVAGLTGEVPNALERAGLLMRTVRSVVGRFGGSVHQLVEDVTGLTLVAAWGTPEAAHEDDAARAAHAAIELQAALAVAGIPARMGVATGRAFCGERGSVRRREYAITGDVMNRAARLMQAASRDVICDEPTAQAAAARLTFQPIAPLVVKGRSEPVLAFRPQAIRPQEGGATIIVGRLAERKRIGARIEAVALGGRGVLLVEGDAGIGKSLLLQYALERARALRLRGALGVAEAVERFTPYFVWRGVLLSLFGGSPAVVAAVRAALAHRPEQLARAPLLNAIVALGLPETEITTHMTAAGRAKATRELLVEVLRHATSVAPALIVLDDGHWCDSASWALAAAVARGVPRLLLVVATRPLDDPVPVEYDRLVRSPDFERLQLCPLSGDDVHALVSRRLGVTSLPAVASAFVQAKAEGNPFFSEQLTFALRDAGYLVIEGETCRLASHAGDLEALPIPGTVQGVVAGRIDRLAPPQQL